MRAFSLLRFILVLIYLGPFVSQVFAHSLHTDRRNLALNKCASLLQKHIESPQNFLELRNQILTDLSPIQGVGKGYSIVDFSKWFPITEFNELHNEELDLLAQSGSTWRNLDLMDRDWTIDVQSEHGKAFEPFIRWLHHFIFSDLRIDGGTVDLIQTELRLMKDNAEFYRENELVHVDSGTRFTALVQLSGEGPFVTSNTKYIGLPISEVKNKSDMYQLKAGQMVILSNQRRPFWLVENMGIINPTPATPHSSPGTSGPRSLLVLRWD